MTLGQKLYEVPSPCGLACEHGLLEGPCWAVRSKLQAGSPERPWRKTRQFPVVSAAVGLTLEHRAGHYFVPCQILPRRKRKHLPSDAVATSSSEAPANLRFAARRAGGSRTAGADQPLGSFQEQDPVGCGGTTGLPLSLPQPHPHSTLCFMSLGQPACLFLSIARSRSVMTGEQMAAFHPPTTPNPLERPIKMGWLKKQRSIVKNWQQRYFVLKARQLYYYKDEEDSKPQVPAACAPLPQSSEDLGLLQAGAHWLLSFL